ncbi:hypothetical protein SDC9_198754 [bioreactor metagenome]|uniref:Uncharacterized protein n=1 Tax=bioreactor metagenome TaxID=1076179 RepID=A0A645IJS6_9ZZZZ
MVGDDERHFSGINAVHKLVDHLREEIGDHHAIDNAIDVAEEDPTGKHHGGIEEQDDFS